MYETCITIRAEHQTIFDIIIYVLKRYKGLEKLSTLISGFCSCIKSVSLINNSWWLKAEAKISGFLKSTKWSGCEYKCLTTSVFWWLDFKGLCSSSRNFKFLCVWPIQELPQEHLSLYTTLHIWNDACRLTDKRFEALMFVNCNKDFKVWSLFFN